MNLLNDFMVVTVGLWVFMSGLYVLALIRKDNSIADIGWGMGFVLVCVLAFWQTPQVTFKSSVLLGLISLWGARLAGHIFARNRGKGEDYRYKKWRQDWGKQWIWRGYLQVFLLQGLLLWVIALPAVSSILLATDYLSLITLLGAGVWLVGILFEAIGDYQLSVFKRDPNNKGKVMNRGLWRYSRHPNYFGEVTLWWGVWLVAWSPQLPWWTIIGPLTISVLILKVSGIPLLEARYVNDPAYQAYAKRTSAFIPLPPKQ